MSDSTSEPLAWIAAELASLTRRGLLRERTARLGPQSAVVAVEGGKVVNFGSNDYLGLAADPRIGDAVAEALRQFGWGSGASPLILGRSRQHESLEEELAAFEGAEAALVFSTGFAANAGAVAALVGPGDVVFTDRKNHASLIDGCRLSRADVRVYPHGDCHELRRLLAGVFRRNYRRTLIVTDGLFSMDGDLAPLGELADLADRYRAMLLVDEAHATGVFGRLGRGVTEHLGVEGRVPIRVGTLSKALGSIGGFVAGTRSLVEWLVNKARPYVFSTALPAAACAAARAALAIVRSEPHRREGLLEQAAALRGRLAQQGWDLRRSASQIVPLVVGDPERAVRLAAALRQRGLFVPAIRPPTVPEGQSCLRISLTCGQSEVMVEQLVESLRELRMKDEG